MAKGLIAIFGITSLFRSPWKPQVLVQGEQACHPPRSLCSKLGYLPFAGALPLESSVWRGPTGGGSDPALGQREDTGGRAPPLRACFLPRDFLQGVRSQWGTRGPGLQAGSLGRRGGRRLWPQRRLQLSALASNWAF